MKFFTDIMRRRAIRKYGKKLGPLLRKRYGRLGAYTTAQIKTTIEQARLPTANICYAYAMFASENEFNSHHLALGKVCNYELMRQEIADLCFAGDGNFTVADAVTYGSSGDFGADGDSGTVASND